VPVSEEDVKERSFHVQPGQNLSEHELSAGR
jgi:hypothetical protein